MAIEKHVNVVISAVDQYSRNMLGFDMSWKTIAASALAVEAAIIAASIAAAKFAVDIGKDIYTSAVDFHDAIFDVEAVASSFGTTAKEIGEVLDDLTNKFPATGKEGGEALQLIAQMGYGTAEQLAKISDAAMTLSIATGTDLRTAAEATMASMNQFGLSIDDVDKVTNLFAATSFTSAATVSDLKEAMKFAGAEAALSGISIEVTAAAIGKLKDKGLEASQAGTTFRMALSQLYRETDQGKESLKKYGLSYDDVKPSVVGLTGIIKAFDGHTLSAEDAMNIFGIRSKAMALLINDGAEAFRKYVNQITDTQAAYDAAEIKLGKWSVVMEQVEGSMDLFKKTIAAEMVPALIDLVGKTANDGIRGVITQLMEMEKKSGAISEPIITLFENLKKTAADLFKDAFGDVEGFYNYLVKITGALTTNLEILSIWGAGLVEAFVGATDEGDELEGMLHAVNGAMLALMTPIAVIHDLFVGFFYTLNLGWDAAEYAILSFAQLTAKAMLETAKLIDKLPFADMTKEIAVMTKEVEYWKTMKDGAFDTDAPELMMKKIGELHAEGTQAIETFADRAKKSYGELAEETDNVVKGTTEWADGVEYAGLWIDKTKKKVEGVVAKTNDLTKASEATTKAVKETEGKLSEIEKFELEMETAKFKSDLKIVEQAAKDSASFMRAELEWEAKIDIKEIEAATREIEISADLMKNAFASVDNSIGVISQSLGDLASEFVSLSKSTNNAIARIADAAMVALSDVAEGQANVIISQISLVEKELSVIPESIKSVVDGMGVLADAMRDQTELAGESVVGLGDLIEKQIDIQLGVVNAYVDLASDSFASINKTMDSLGVGIKGIVDLANAFVSGDLSVKEKETMLKLMESQIASQQELVNAQITISENAFIAIDESLKTMSEKIDYAISVYHMYYQYLLDDRSILQNFMKEQISVQQSLVNAEIDLIQTIPKEMSKILKETKGVFAPIIDETATQAAYSRMRISSEAEKNRKFFGKYMDEQIILQGDLIATQADLLSEIKEQKKREIQVDVQGDIEGWLKGLTQSLLDEIMIKAQTEAFSCFGTE